MNPVRSPRLGGCQSCLPACDSCTGKLRPAFQQVWVRETKSGKGSGSRLAANARMAGKDANVAMHPLCDSKLPCYVYLRARACHRDFRRMATSAAGRQFMKHGLSSCHAPSKRKTRTAPGEGGRPGSTELAFCEVDFQSAYALPARRQLLSAGVRHMLTYLHFKQMESTSRSCRRRRPQRPPRAVPAHRERPRPPPAERVPRAVFRRRADR